jgi:acetolactate synthase-1/2/3 large subunit
VQYDAQLQSDIETVARNVSTWVRTTVSPSAVGKDAAEAVAAAIGPPGEVATLILPADVSWSDGAQAAPPQAAASPSAAPANMIETVAAALRSGGRTALLLGGRALREPGLIAAGRIAAATGAKLLAEVFPTRLERGAGLPAVERIAYLPELAMVQLAGLKHLVLVDAKPPVSFFAYPGKKSYLVDQATQVHVLCPPERDMIGSLEALVEALGAESAAPVLQPATRPRRPAGSLTAEKACQAIGAVLPEGVIISDEAQTSGLTLAASTAGAPRHDVLALTGGAIGQGLPVAVGAALACPDRPVLALEADGSALYTIQALWTMAREQLNVTVVIFNNRSYGILNVELARVGAQGGGPKASAQLDLSPPDVDFVALAKGLGVPAQRVDTAEALCTGLERALAEPGPKLLEVVIPTVFSPRQLKALPYALRALTALPRPVAAAVKRRLYP